jgi:hypothetical protein
MYAVTPYARRRHARTSKGEAPPVSSRLRPARIGSIFVTPPRQKLIENEKGAELSSSFPLSKQTFLCQPLQHRGAVYLPPRKVECACTL